MELAKSQIDKNILIHDRIAKRYEKDHVEIFNDVEQSRLRNKLLEAAEKIQSIATPYQALDFGCGSGNLTRHLLHVGMDVTAADVSQEFLNLVEYRHPSARLKTVRLNGRDLANLPDQTFDFIAMYSVLHHIPDYLGALKELGGKCKPGGVIYIDHENNDEFWLNSPVYQKFRKEAALMNWKKYLTPANYVHKLRQMLNPRYTNEGDIHVWPDDHIEWEKIRETLGSCGFEVVIEEDYLLFNKLYRPEVYDKYRHTCTDSRVMAFRKNFH